MPGDQASTGRVNTADGVAHSAGDASRDPYRPAITYEVPAAVLKPQRVAARHKFSQPPARLRNCSRRQADDQLVGIDHHHQRPRDGRADRKQDCRGLVIAQAAYIVAAKVRRSSSLAGLS